MAEQSTVTVETPVAQPPRSKKTIAGVEFVEGRAELASDDPKLGYFRRRGYTIDGERPDTADETDRVDARDATGTTVGTPLRDAAVNPTDDDFLPPVNAGEADPHGPEVVAPEIHAATDGPKPVVPGPVPDDPDAQEEKEQAATVEAVDGATPEPPAKSANKPEWEAYATRLGIDTTGTTKAQIQAAVDDQEA